MAYVTTANVAEESKITSYQWLCLLSAFAGWMFDSMDLNLFTLVLFPSVASLTKLTNPAEIARYGGYIMAIKLLCWGVGGILFGVVADRFGRSRTMVITIVIYAVFTGLSGLAQNWIQLAACRRLPDSASGENGPRALRSSPRAGRRSTGRAPCRSCRWRLRSAFSRPHSTIFCLARSAGAGCWLRVRCRPH